METKKKVLNALLEKLKNPDNWNLEYMTMRYKKTTLEVWADSTLCGKIFKPYKLEFSFFDSFKLRSAVFKVYNELIKKDDEKELKEILEILND